MKQNLIIFMSLLGMLSGPVLAQSTLDRYLRKNSQGTGATADGTPADSTIISKSSDGYWRLDDTRSTDGFCALTYFASSNFAGYVGPVVGNPDSFILFGGPTIPPIQKEKKKRVTLKTADGTVHSVMAFHVPNGRSKDSGVILFRLKDIQAAISEMSDVEDLSVVMDKGQIFAIKWTGGRLAQQAMQACINKMVPK